MNLARNLNNLLQNRFPEKQMTTIAQTLLEIAANDVVQAEMLDIKHHIKTLMEAMKSNDSFALEHAMVNLYAHLHVAGATYSSDELKLLKTRDGYSCISGGLSPLIKAEPFINSESIVADLGAGNGLQGLLLQRLYPHKRTLQIELSSEMIRMGKIFQKALGINNNRLKWINADITDVSLETVDFIYIYRPAHPSENGKKLYQVIANKLITVDKPLIIFSVADCLSEFLDEHFSIFYTDGHLTCFSNG